MAADLSQADFCRLARGGDLAPPGGLPAEKIVLGISSASHAAVRRVHNETPEIALSNLAGTLRKYFLSGGQPAQTARRYQGCVESYIAWDGHAAPATETPARGRAIGYDGGIVRARPDVILANSGTGEYEVRVLLWDELPLDRDSAELIALPAAERVEETYGPGKVAVVKVLHLAINNLEEVAADSAHARRADVAELLASV